MLSWRLLVPASGRSDPAQKFVDADLGQRLLVDLLHDHRAIQTVAAILGRQVAGHHDRTGGHATVHDITGLAVVDLGRLADVDAHRDHAVVFDDHAFDHFGARADEADVADDGGVGLHRLEHAADADAAREVDVLADLRAGADRGPGVDHGAFTDIGADVDVGGHQHDVLADVGALARSGGRHDAEAALAEVFRVEVGELGGHLVVVIGIAALVEGVVFQAERQQHRFLQPLVGDPVLTFAALSDAQFAHVEQVDHGHDRVLDLGLHVARGDVSTAFKGVFDDFLQVLHDVSFFRRWGYMNRD